MCHAKSYFPSCSGSGNASKQREAALKYARARFPRFFQAPEGSSGSGQGRGDEGRALRPASESGMEVLLEEGDAIFFPAYWFHYTESMDLSFSLGYRYLDLRA